MGGALGRQSLVARLTPSATSICASGVSTATHECATHECATHEWLRRACADPPWAEDVSFRLPRGPAGWTFFRQWLRSPLTTAAVVPSGRQLAARMLAPIPARPRSVIELGAGTGVFTRALLAAGLAPHRLLVVERNRELHGILRRRFPSVTVVRGDAADLPGIARGVGFGQDVPVDAVLSGLGLRPMASPVQKAILAGAFEMLAPGGIFVQFTYGRTGPVASAVLSESGLGERRVSIAWRNLPPAAVFVYRSLGVSGLPR